VGAVVAEEREWEGTVVGEGRSEKGGWMSGGGGVDDMPQLVDMHGRGVVHVGRGCGGRGCPVHVGIWIGRREVHHGGL
jgi:hypothetical protein